MDDEKDDQSCNPSQHREKLVVCNKPLNHQEEEEGSQWNVSLCISNSKFLCQE